MKRSLLAKNKLAFILTDPDGCVRFCCVECSAKYDDKEGLERHLLEHNKEYRFLCGICGTGWALNTCTDVTKTQIELKYSFYLLIVFIFLLIKF